MSGTQINSQNGIETLDRIASPQEIIAFWRAAGHDKWFTKDEAFDAEVRSRFLPTYEAAAAGRLAQWESDPVDVLALALVLDQFPRNMFRGNARVYAADDLARRIVKHAIANGLDQRAPADLRSFLYMPLMHSETLSDQEQCILLFEAHGDPENIKFARHHAEIVRRFGRFPHRNEILGRQTTPEEQAFLDVDGFRG